MSMIRHLTCPLIAVFFMAGIEAQTIYRCPETNGRMLLQDIPCTGGEQRQIRPASGADQKPKAPEKSETITAKAAPKSELDRLRDSVGKDAAARKFKDADYEVSVYDKRINNFPTYRIQTLDAEAIFNICGSGKYTYRCEDMAHRARVDARLSVEYNQMLDMRTNAHAVKRAANKEHFNLTQKWLEE